MNDLSSLIERLPWKPHVVKNGSREHVTIWGSITGPAGVFPVTWCSYPFCDDNQTMVEWLIENGIDPLDASPPPKLAQALQSSHPATASGIVERESGEAR